jgi:hypothetical protein
MLKIIKMDSSSAITDRVEELDIDLEICIRSEYFVIFSCLSVVLVRLQILYSV